MKLWRFHDPQDGRFAHAGRRGTWQPPAKGMYQERIPPLIIEWEPGSDVIGDFTWPGFDSELVVTERVGDALRGRFLGFELRSVEMIQDPKLKRPQRVTRRTKPRVWLPYEGPPLRDLWVTAWADADLARSTLRAIGEHPELGYMRYELSGDEHLEWLGKHVEPPWRRVAREAGKGLYVATGQLEGMHIFRVRQMPGWILCTDAVRQFILKSGFTNVDFFEMGKTS